MEIGPDPAQTGEAAQDSAWADLIERERMKTLYRQMPIALAVTVINVALTLTVMMQADNAAALWAWAAAIALLTVVRLGLWRAYWRHPARDATVWTRVAILGALAAGLLWGLAGLLFYPVDALHQAFLAFVIAGMCAGAVTVSSARFASLVAFVLPATLPLALRFLLESDRLHAVMGVMVLIFAAALLLIGRLFGGYFTDTFRLNLALAERGRALDRSNASLRAEIARHETTEATLRQSQKLEALGRLTGGIAHDFNNVLAGVIGFVGIALKRLDKDVHLKPLLENALKAADRGAALTQRLLAFARKQTLNPRPVDLAALVAEMRPLIEHAAGAGLNVQFHVAGGAANALVDSGQLELAILNLVINARDAMAEGGTLSIEVTERFADGSFPPGLADGHYAVVAVTDTGIGMDEETLAKAFEPFFTTKPAGSGSGLGLSMVQGFAAQSGGTVQLASRKGEGTRADIWLPRSTGDAGVSAREALAPTPAAHARILLCDDDADTRAAVAEMLRCDGHAVTETASADAALTVIEEDGAIDILVTDYAMPAMNGAELAAEAARRRPGLKTLLISGHPAALGDDTLRGAMLAKPFTQIALANRIAQLQSQAAGQSHTA
jgi:signal transduction histidine kinase